VAEVVFLLCALTSLTCTALLLRGYKRSRARLLLWSGLCFVGLAMNNVLLLADKVFFPEIDFSTWRSVAALAGLILLLYGLIWDAE
jgi:hypothetical protein